MPYLPAIDDEQTLVDVAQDIVWVMSWSNPDYHPVLCVRSELTVYPIDQVYINKLDDQDFNGITRYKMETVTDKGHVQLLGALVANCGDMSKAPVRLTEEKEGQVPSLNIANTEFSEQGAILLFSLPRKTAENQNYINNTASFPDYGMPKVNHNLPNSGGFFTGKGDNDDGNHPYLPAPVQSQQDILIIPFYNNGKREFIVTLTEPDGGETVITISQEDTNWLQSNYRSSHELFSARLCIHLSQRLCLRRTSKHHPKMYVMQLLRSIYHASESAAFNELMTDLTAPLNDPNKKAEGLGVTGFSGNIRCRNNGSSDESKQRNHASSKITSSEGSKEHQQGNKKKTELDENSEDNRNDGSKPPDNNKTLDVTDGAANNTSRKRKIAKDEEGEPSNKKTKSYLLYFLITT